MKSRSNQITGPSINRHNSKQDYCTPREFLRAVEKRFGAMAFDLAATKENTVVKRYYFNQKQDALKQDWMQLNGNLWLNPPFGDIAPWARKCALSFTNHTQIFLLTPAAVGSNWFAAHIFQVAPLVLFLSPRLSFDGKAPYPKDCMLSVFTRHVTITTATQFECWRWK